MAVLTELSHWAIEQALTQFDVGTLLEFKPASAGIENTNYFIKTIDRQAQAAPTQEFVFTLIEDPNDDAKARREMSVLLEHCYTSGLPVPRLARTIDGHFEGKVLRKAVILCSRLSGTHTVHPVREQCEAIGRFLARMHLACSPIQNQISEYHRDVNWLNGSANRVLASLENDEAHLLRHALKRIEKTLSRPEVQQLPRSVVHGDLFLDNALFDPIGLTGVIDFHHAGRGFCIYDLAVALNDWCCFEEQMQLLRVESLLGAYNKVRRLTVIEIALLSDFLLYSAVAFWLSRLLVSVRLDLPADYPRHDPNQFKRLVEKHMLAPTHLNYELFR